MADTEFCEPANRKCSRKVCWLRVLLAIGGLSVLTPYGYHIIGNFAKCCGDATSNEVLLRGVAEGESLLYS